MRARIPSWRVLLVTAAYVCFGLTLLFVASITWFNSSDRANEGDDVARGFTPPLGGVSSAGMPALDAGSNSPATTLTSTDQPDAAGVALGELSRDTRQLVAGREPDRVQLDDFAGAPILATVEEPFPAGRALPSPFTDAGAPRPPPVPAPSVDASAPRPIRDAGTVLPDSGSPPPLPLALTELELQSEAQEATAASAISSLEREPCGVHWCPAGTVCCNESCGTCTAPGQGCSKLSCSVPPFPVSVGCGRNTCSTLEVCCNPSCGICALPGEPCSQRRCD